MTHKHQLFEQYLGVVDPDSIFVEIGSENGEGSTATLAGLAKQHQVKFITVDAEFKPIRSSQVLAQKWQEFYHTVRADSWPDADSIQDLPLEAQHECINVWNWNESIEGEYGAYGKYLFGDLDFDFYQEIGSAWASTYSEKIAKPISLLYLDNFDYIWDVTDIPDWIHLQIKEYKKQFNVVMNNRNCQIEHFKQILSLESWLAPGALVGMDDTYLFNDCWIGKSGPGVIYLLSLGYTLEHYSGKFVILRKPA
jgi:hypothetical protein